MAFETGYLYDKRIVGRLLPFEFFVLNIRGGAFRENEDAGNFFNGNGYGTAPAGNAVKRFQHFLTRFGYCTVDADKSECENHFAFTDHKIVQIGVSSIS